MQKTDQVSINVESVIQKAERLYSQFFRTINNYWNPPETKYFEICSQDLFDKLINECHSLPIYYYTRCSFARLLVDGLIQDMKGDAAGWVLLFAMPVAFVITSPIDLPIAVFAFSTGVVASIPIEVAKLSCQKFDQVIDTITNRRSNHSRSPYCQFLFQQSLKLRSAMRGTHVDENKLAILMDQILSDIKLLANSSSSSILHVGTGYMEQTVELTGLRHYITGRSKLADLIHQHILSDTSLELDDTVKSDYEPKAIESQSLNRQITAGLRTRGLFSDNQTQCLTLDGQTNNSKQSSDITDIKQSLQLGLQ